MTNRPATLAEVRERLADAKTAWRTALWEEVRLNTQRSTRITMDAFQVQCKAQGAVDKLERLEATKTRFDRARQAYCDAVKAWFDNPTDPTDDNRFTAFETYIEAQRDFWEAEARAAC